MSDVCHLRLTAILLCFELVSPIVFFKTHCKEVVYALSEVWRHKLET